MTLTSFPGAWIKNPLASTLRENERVARDHQILGSFLFGLGGPHGNDGGLEFTLEAFSKPPCLCGPEVILV